MPSCTYCGCEEFNDVDGYSYCADCNKLQASQGQTVLQESYIGNQGFGATTATGDVENAARPSQKKQRNLKKSAGTVSSLPFVTTEAYAFIFKHQIECLVNHGAHLKLKETAERIYALYLSKLGLAFTHDPFNIDLPFFKLRPSYRDLVPPTRDNPFVIKSFMWGDRREPLMRYKIGNVKEEASELDSVKLPSFLYNPSTLFMSESLAEEFTEEDVDVGELITGSLAPNYREIDHNKRHYAQIEGRAKYKRSRADKLVRAISLNLPLSSPFILSSGRLLCLIYYSLLLSGHYVTPGMVLRWAYCGVFPYLRMEKILPKEFKFQVRTDTTMTSGRKRHHKKFLFDLKIMADFLTFYTLPLPPFQLILVNFIDRLGLPRDFFNYTQSIFEKCPFSQFSKRGKASAMMFDQESLAIAFIAVAFRVVLAIDEQKCFRKMMMASRKLQQLLEGVELFNFEKWLSALETYSQEANDTQQDLSVFSKDSEANQAERAERKLNKKCMEASRELSKLLGIVEDKLKATLRHRQDFAKFSSQENLSWFKSTRSAHFGLSTFEDVMEVFGPSSMPNSAKENIEEALKSIQAAGGAAKLLPLKTSDFSKAVNTAQNYGRLVKTACSAVFPLVVILPEDVHKWVCIIESELAGQSKGYKIGKNRKACLKKYCTGVES